MAAVPPWMLGRHVTQVLATIQTVAADGTLADSAVIASLVATTGVLHTSIVFTQGIIDELEWSATKLTENVSPIHSIHAHHVPVSIAYEFTLTEILRMGSGNTLLAGIWHGGASSIILFEFTRARRKWQTYAALVSLDESIQRGKNVARLTCRQVDAGAATVVVTTGVDR